MDEQLQEDVEQVDELSKGTLGSYVKKASQSATDHGAEYGRKKADQDSVNRSLNRHGVSSQDKDAAHKAYKTTDTDVSAPEKKASKRLKGINTAVKKLTGEEEQVEEANCGCGQTPCKTYGKVDEAKATMCGRCGTKHVAPKDGGTCPAVKEEADLEEKTLTPAEKKKREDVAKAIERDNPDMPMDKKMAIATATAKKVAESSISDRTRRLIERAIKRNT